MKSSLKLIQRAQKWSHRTAIVSNQQTYTYQQLLDTSNTVAAHLLNGIEDLNCLLYTSPSPRD